MSNVEHETIVFEAVTRQASSEIQQLSRQYRAATKGMSDDALRLAVAQDKLDKALSRHGAGSTQAKQAELAYRAEIKRTTESLQAEGVAADKAGRELNQLGRGAVAGTGIMRGFGRSIAFASASFLGTAGLVYAIRSAVRTGLDFEREMRNVNSIARLSEGEFQNLTQSVLELAGPSAQAPKTLAQGLYDLESSGFSASDSLKILEASSKAATAGLTDNATATKAVAAALNAYHLPAEQARRVSDILFSTVDKGVISFEELAQNMGDLVPAAAPLGVKLSEIGAAIATITLQGVPAAEAATRVNRSLLLLAKPSDQLKQIFKEQGYASAEAAVKAVGYAGVLDLIDKKTQGNVAATAKLAPEIRALLGVVGLTGKNLAVYQENLDAIEHSQDGAGRTAQVFAEQSKSTSFQLQRLSANVQTLEISFASALAPAINKAAAGISDWLEKGDNLERVQRDITSAVQTGAKVVEGLAKALGVLHDAVGPVVDGLGGIEKATELAFGAALLLKLRKAAGSFGILTASSAATRTRMVADAEAVEIAWDAATRPRNLVVTGGGIGGAAGRSGGLLGLAGGPIGLGVTAIAGSYFYNKGKRQEALAQWNSLSGAEQRKVVQNNPEAIKSLESVGYTFKPVEVKPGAGAAASPDSTTRAGGRTSSTTSSPPAGNSPGSFGGGTSTAAPSSSSSPRRTILDIQTDLARAQATGDTAGETRYLQEERDRYKRQIAFFEARKTLTDKQKETLQRLYGELQSAQGQLDSIAADKEAALDKQRQDAADKRAKQLAARKAKEEADAKRLQEQTDRINAFAQKNVDRINAALRKAKSGKQLIAEQQAAATATAKKAAGADTITKDDLSQFTRDAFLGAVDIMNRYGANFAGGSGLNNYILEQINRAGNKQLEQIARNTAYRAARPVDDAMAA